MTRADEIQPMEIRNILCGHVSNVSNITRFSLSARLKPESVAEHGYWVATISLLIASHVQEEGYHINWQRLALRAVLHDMEEALTSDFPRPFKHSTPELNEAIEKAADIAARTVSNELSNVDELSHRFYTYWKEAKSKDTEGRIIALADFLSVIQWGLREKKLGSRAIHKDLRELSKYVEQFDDPSFAFLGEYTDQARRLTEEVLDPHG